MTNAEKYGMKIARRNGKSIITLYQLGKYIEEPLPRKRNNKANAHCCAVLHLKVIDTAEATV